MRVFVLRAQFAIRCGSSELSRILSIGALSTRPSHSGILVFRARRAGDLAGCRMFTCRAIRAKGALEAKLPRRAQRAKWYRKVSLYRISSGETILASMPGSVVVLVLDTHVTARRRVHGIRSDRAILATVRPSVRIRVTRTEKAIGRARWGVTAVRTWQARARLRRGEFMCWASMADRSIPRRRLASIAKCAG